METQTGDQDIQDVPRLIQAKNHQDQEVSKHKCDIWHRFDANVESCNNRGSGTHSNDTYDPAGCLGELILTQFLWKKAQSSAAFHNLFGSDTQRSGEAGDNGHNGHDVQQVPEPSPGGLPQHRGKGRAEAQRQALPVGQETHGDGR